MLRDSFHVLSPAVEDAFLDVGLGNVVDDDLEVRHFFEERGHIRKVWWTDQQVVGNLARFEFLQASNYFWLQHPSDVGLVVNEMPNSNKFRMFLKLIEDFSDSLVLKIDPSD